MKNILSVLLCLNFCFISAQITLTHNLGNVPVKTNMFSCEFSQSWARTFTLSDFGIPKNNKFIINSGQIGIYNSLGGSSLQFNIYKIDANFPNSLSHTNLIGSSQIVGIPIIGETPEIIQVNFNTPVIIPDGVERILVEVMKFYDVQNEDTSIAYIAGTELDNDISWYWGCQKLYSHLPTEDLDPSVQDANFFINVTGEPVSTNNLGTNTKLTHNLCDDLVDIKHYSCSWGGLKYARTFVLEDFGVSENEEFIIDRGQVAFASVGVHDVKIQFNIYKIDDNFPDSYSANDLIGSSQIIYVPYFGSGNGVKPKIFEVFFGTPIVVPSDVDKILVEVFNLDSSSSSGLVFIAGGTQSNDVSWLRSEASGCPPFRKYIAITKPGTNYFINVTGKTNHVTNNFEMNISNICSEFLKEFSVENKANVASVVWDFGDPVSGTNNISTDLSPFHDFSSDDNYTITATITGFDGTIEILTETIDVKEPPNAYGISNLEACEDILNTGFSSAFDTSNIQSQVLGSQTGRIVTYIDSYGNEYDQLPNPFANNRKDNETITVRVARNDEPCCYSETTFDLIVNPLPEIPTINDILECDDNNDGLALFDLKSINDEIINKVPNAIIEFSYQDGTQITSLNVQNKIENEEIIKVNVTNSTTYCSNETVFKIIVNPLPIANPLAELIGCDDNNDGISEYFDISYIESQVLGNQLGMLISYFDNNGDEIHKPLTNPYFNKTPYFETITVRVTNLSTTCYKETELVLKTSSKPQINKPNNIYACNEGNGYGSFDTSNIKSEIIGDQPNLDVYYFDNSGREILNFEMVNFQNTELWSQTIYVKVENVLSNLCYSETEFSLIVNELPKVDLQDDYFLCNLEPSLTIDVDTGFSSYLWTYQDGSVISNLNIADLANAGNYTLTIEKSENGIFCEESFRFNLIRSTLPKITDVNFKELSDNNFVEIIATGDGDFEYSINGVDYQASNRFNKIQGGIYTVSVRDKLGCGEDSDKIVVLDYPKYFTPNGDAVNDTWQIKGVSNYPNAIIYIYDRYGKFLKQIAANSIGWDGTFNGKQLLSSDYWFVAKLDNATNFSGHFTLKR